MLDELDRYSLETQRPITLPLLRSCCNSNPKINNTMNLAHSTLTYCCPPLRHEWGQFLARIGAVDPDALKRATPNGLPNTRPVR